MLRCVYPVVLSILLLPLPLGAQSPTPPAGQGDIVVTLKGNVRPQVRMAFPAMERKGAATPAATRAMDELESALRSDLDLSRLFEVQGPRELQVLTLTGEPSRDFEQYRSLGNEVVLLADLAAEGDRIVLEGRLFDLANGQSILGKRYRGTFDLARRVAHAFADEIVRYFTGRRGIALTSIAFSSDRDGYKELWVMDYDGANQRRITGHKSISMSPDWSPTGDSIVYVSFFGGGPGIYLVDLATGLKKPVTAAGALNSSPSFSPDGKQIVYSHSEGGNTEIYISNRDGSNVRRLTNSPGIDTNPAWSPNGQLIVFTSDRAGNPHLYVMDPEGANLRRVTFDGTYNDNAAWNPAGDRIAYATMRRPSGFDIAVMDVSLFESRVITTGPGSHESPAYSPDGRRLAFTTRQGDRTQVYVMDAEDGTHLRQLTTEGNNTTPDWSGYSER